MRTDSLRIEEQGSAALALGLLIDRATGVRRAYERCLSEGIDTDYSSGPLLLLRACPSHELLAAIAIAVIIVGGGSAQHGPCDRRLVVWGRQTPQSSPLRADHTQPLCACPCPCPSFCRPLPGQRHVLHQPAPCQTACRGQCRLIIHTSRSWVRTTRFLNVDWSDTNRIPTAAPCVGEEQVHSVSTTFGATEPRSTSALKAHL